MKGLSEQIGQIVTRANFLYNNLTVLLEFMWIKEFGCNMFCQVAFNIPIAHLCNTKDCGVYIICRDATRTTNMLYQWS